MLFVCLLNIYCKFLLYQAHVYVLLDMKGRIVKGNVRMVTMEWVAAWSATVTRKMQLDVIMLLGNVCVNRAGEVTEMFLKETAGALLKL